MPLTLRYIARSDVGLVREGNEDSGYAGPFLLAVADGMGGHAAGEVASQAAIDELVHADHAPTAADPVDELATAIDAANARIRQLVVEDSAREGMGTTATVARWDGTGLTLGHIGDSRAYRLRQGTLTQLTRDHTFVQSLVDEGRITPEDARAHPARSVVTKVLQGQATIDPDYSHHDVQAGDRLLICSDGLSDVVSDDAIEEALNGAGSLDDAGDTLVGQALAAGAPDNITVVLGEIVDGSAERQPDDTAEAFLVGAAGANARDETARSEATHLALRGSRTRAPSLPRSSTGRGRLRLIVPVIVAVAVAALGGAGMSAANSWIQQQYYIGHSSGQVAIYQGVRQELGPIRLSELHELPGGLPVESLPADYRRQVHDTIETDDLDSAERIVAGLRRHACLAHRRLQPPGAGTSRDDGGWLGSDVGFPGLLCTSAANLGRTR